MPNTTPTVTAPSTVGLNLSSLARIALVGIGTSLLVKPGILDNEQLQTVVSALIIVGTVAWSFYKNHSMNQKVVAAMAAPQVKVVTPSGDAVPPTKIAGIMFAVLVVVFMARGLTACQTAPLAPPSVQAGLLVGDTSLDAVYKAAIKAYIAAAPHLTASQRANAHDLIPKVYAAVVAADNAQKGASTTDFATQLAVATNLIAQLKSIGQ